MDTPRFKTPIQGEQYPSEYDIPSAPLADLIARDVTACEVRTLDLSSAGSLTIEKPGRAFVFFDYATGDGTKTPINQALVNVRINNPGDSSFPGRSGRGFRGTFKTLYLSWAAQSGVSIDFVVFKSKRMPWNALAGVSGAGIVIAPTITTLTLGSGNYVPPVGAKYLKIIARGAGAGGWGSGTTAGTAPTGGGSTTFGSLVTCSGAGVSASQLVSGAPGTASYASPAYGNTFTGNYGLSAQQTTSTAGNEIYPYGGAGAPGYQGGSGSSVQTSAGGNAQGNSGAGGGGGGGALNGGTATFNAGAGGSAGGHFEGYIPGPLAASYPWTVSAGGAGGGAGSGGYAGGNGASGIIILEEHYG